MFLPLSIAGVHGLLITRDHFTSDTNVEMKCSRIMRIMRELSQENLFTTQHLEKKILGHCVVLMTELKSAYTARPASETFKTISFILVHYAGCYR